MNTWIAGKDMMKHFYLKKNVFTVTMEDITYADYMHAKKVWKDFKIKHLGEYYDLYVQNDTYFQMYLKTLEINVLKYMNLIWLIFYLCQD